MTAFNPTPASAAVVLLRFLFVLSSNLTNEGEKASAGRLLGTALGPVRVSPQVSESVTAVIKKNQIRGYYT
jgi:hypothetical protein